MQPNNIPENETRQPAIRPAAASNRPLQNGFDSSQTNHSSSPVLSKDVYRAIAEVTKMVSRNGIAKGRRNQQQGYSFRGIDDICNALAPMMAEAGLCILPRYSEREQTERVTANDKTLFYVTIRGDFDFVSARDGSIHTVSTYGEAMDSADKATNKAMSAAFKYALMQAYCIPTEGDNDADAHSPTVRPRDPQHPSFDEIDKGGHPAGTQAAAQAVRDRKLADIPPPAKPATSETNGRPWKNPAEMRRVFEQLREQIGEVQYEQEMERAGVPSYGHFRSYNAALDCYRRLAVIAQREVA